MDDPGGFKVTVSGDVSTTVSRLSLRHPAPRKMWFLEDLAGRSSATRSGTFLPDAGVIVRLRNHDDESTVKLRPCCPQLSVNECTRSHPKNRNCSKYRVEWDCTGSRGVPAASAVDALDDGVVNESHRGAQPPRTPSAANSFATSPTVWKLRFRSNGCVFWVLSRPPSGADDVSEADVERWQGGDLNFQEYSVRVGVGGDPVLADENFHAASTVWACRCEVSKTPRP
jgi:hypothetical protein